jgi:nitrogen regulatory protein P-II 1
MKEIKAVIRPVRLDDVREALRHVPGFPGMTIGKVDGCSSPARHTPHGIREELLDYSPKVRIEMVVQDEYVDALCAVLKRVAATGHVGDGLIWVTQVASFDYIWNPVPG